MKSRLTPRHTRLALATGVLVMVVIAISAAPSLTYERTCPSSAGSSAPTS
jgi:hypothetical protein